MQSLDFLKAFIEPLEKANISYFITGSIASIYYGEPRLTHDVDIVLHLPQEKIEAFPKLYPLEQFYCPPEEIIHIESRRPPFGHFNLIHHETGFKADIYSDAGDPLHKWAFANKKRIDLSKGLSVWLAPAEYVIIRKLEFFREGGSQKHVEDIRKMLPQVEADLDKSFLQREMKTRGLEQAWQKVLA